MTLTAAEWFEDIDAELAYALKMESNAKAAHEERAATQVMRKPGRKIPARPAKPVLQTVTTTPPMNPPSSVTGLGLPGSERLEPISLAPTKPTKQLVPPTKPLVLRERPTKTDILVSADGSTKKYLKAVDKNTLNDCSEYKYPTTRHLALLRNTSDNYMPRRLKQLAEDLLLAKHTDPIGYNVWSLLHRGAGYSETQLPPIKERPHGDDHFQRENLNTLMSKLAVGVDESILYPKSEGYKLEPLAIIQTRWLEESAATMQGERDYLGLRGEQLHQIINDSRHPVERAWKSEDELRKGVPEPERSNLLLMYKTLDHAHLLTVLGRDGKPSLAVSPHAVILRPITEATVRADGRVVDYSMNHDALRIESIPYTSENFDFDRLRASLRDLLYSMYHSKMFGRLHEFTDSEVTARHLRGAYDSLIFSGHLPRQEFPSNHPECWLRVHPLPQPLNNMGKGVDKYDEDGIRRALTKADG